MMNNNRQILKQKQRGFTLIELMIVIAILGILASIAIAAYQDYTIRSKVSEAIVITASTKTAVGDFYWVNSTLPVNRTETGQSNIQTKYVTGITIVSDGVTDGIISVDIDETNIGIRGQTADDMYLIIRPLIRSGALDWRCSVNNAVDGTGDDSTLRRFVPSVCRN